MPKPANGSSSLLDDLNQQAKPKNTVSTIGFNRYLHSGQMLLIQVKTDYSLFTNSLFRRMLIEDQKMKVHVMFI